MMPRIARCSLAVAAATLIPPTHAMARGIADDIGLTDLIARLGPANAPTGAGIAVAQVEPLDNGNYRPDPNHPDFVGKTFTFMSGPSGNSGHATFVGQNFYGTSFGPAPGILDIFSYSAAGWTGTGFLHSNQPGVQPEPLPPGVRLINNSWIGNFPSAAGDNDCLRRADFVINHDSILMCNGVSNTGLPVLALMQFGFNSIAVGTSTGGHVSYMTPAGWDGPGRMKPEIVAPQGATSFATPIVNAVGALLMETADTDKTLLVDFDARRAEVLKAALLAGATHRPGWSNNPATSGPARGITTTPIDPQDGVDVVNANRSHLILTGYQQNAATSPPTTDTIVNRGWDLVNIPTNGSRYYRFHVGQTANEVSILATWNRTVASNFASFSLANVNLTLWRVDENGSLVTLVGDPGLPYFGGGNIISQSSVDNIEHLYITNLQPGDYTLEVKRVDAFVANWDVGVAWLLPKRTGDIDGDGHVDVDDLLDVIRGWGLCPDPCVPICPADLTGDCNVNVDDLLIVIANWG